MRFFPMSYAARFVPRLLIALSVNFSRLFRKPNPGRQLRFWNEQLCIVFRRANLSRRLLCGVRAMGCSPAMWAVEQGEMRTAMGSRFGRLRRDRLKGGAAASE
jgi:hypothetical protein